MKDSYSLRQVVDLTGLSEFTLRGWEARYGAFSPRRTSTGRRQYAGADLKKALLLRELLKRGHRIGDVAELSNLKLGKMMDQLGGANSANSAEEVSLVPHPAAPPAVEQAMALVALQKWDKLEEHFAKHSRGSGLKVMRSFIFPLIQELGRSVGQGVVTIAQEHIFSALLKEQLYALRARAQKPRNRRRFVVAAPEGDFHDIGILTAHVLISLHGSHSLFVGANSPKKELCETALRFGATHVLMGSTVSRREGAREDLTTVLHFLDRHLPQQVSVWTGGRNVLKMGITLHRPFEMLTSLTHLDSQLQLGSHRGPRS